MKTWFEGFAVLSFIALGLVACAHTDRLAGGNPGSQSLAAAAPRATAMLLPLANSGISGKLMLTQLPEGGVKIEGTVHGLKPEGLHGFHIHEVGNCDSPDGSSAGGHFNPTGQTHGDPSSPSTHLGDLGNVQADAQGDALVFVVKAHATLSAGPNSIVGRSLIVHQLADDLKTQPSGGSGSRLACGVIKSN